MSDISAKISKYINGTSQYPLLVVISYDEYRILLSSFSGMPKIKVSDYCPGDDKEPDIFKMLDDIKKKRGDYLLLGLGEYLAGKGDAAARSLLSPFKDAVLQDGSHVTILLSAHMYPVAKEIIRNDLRAKPRFVLPDDIPDIPIIENNALVNGIKEYLKACEKGKPAGKVKTSRKISGTTVINPKCAYDELRINYPNELNRLPQNIGADEDWANLLTELNKSKKTLIQYLSEQGFSSPEYIFPDYARRKDYSAWLYLLWIKLQADSRSYLGYVALKASSHNSLLDTAMTAILDISVTDKRFSSYYKQRKQLLTGCNDADMSDFIPKIHHGGIDRIAYLTDNTKVEKQAVIVSLCEGAKSDYVKTSYPDLYAYLQDYRFDNDSLTEYFSSYKKSKVFNKVDEEFLSVVNDNAINRPYNSLPSRSSVFSSLDEDQTLLIWLDALGVEFLGYIKAVCAELDLRFIPKIARANLPTITSTNREFYDNWQGHKETPIKDIDELKHHPERGYEHTNSPYPIHLVEELDAVREALERAKVKLRAGSQYQKVVIASDHGASRLAVISERNLLGNNNFEVKANGRYCQGMSPQDAPIFVSENIASEGEYAVIADYSRFETSRSGSVEVHGGASLEEVIVPIIELTLSNKDIKVTLENDTIETSYKKDAELIMIITPELDNVTASVNSIEYEVTKLDKSRYSVLLKALKKGTYTLEVSENQNKVASKEFTIKSKGFAERDMF